MYKILETRGEVQASYDYGQYHQRRHDPYGVGLIELSNKETLSERLRNALENKNSNAQKTNSKDKIL